MLIALSSRFSRRPHGRGALVAAVLAAVGEGLGLTGRTRYEDWESAEPTLESEWESARGGSSLSWPQARPASRAAWDRIESVRTGTMPGMDGTADSRMGCPADSTASPQGSARVKARARAAAPLPWWVKPRARAT